jgi:AAA+ ATPase superfamily predicted ATPase
MGTVVGQVARGKDFWDRENELEDIWKAIESGSHILISAPRRVGKTSIMYKVVDEPKAGYIPIYVNTESADSQWEFWHKLFHALVEEEFVNGLKAQASLLWTKLKGINITKISADGIEFGDGVELSFIDAFKQLINDLDSDKKLLIMIDEFAQTIENIIKFEDEKTAISLLKNHRELRQDRKFSEKVTFIYAGSIGLESVVAKIDASKHINDLNSIKVKPLERGDAMKFVIHLFKENKKDIAVQNIEYLLDKIEWLIPFYIQLIVQETVKLQREMQDVQSSAIDKAFEEALEHKQYFESWLSKIKTSFKNGEFLFAKMVLNKTSEEKTITFKQIVNLASKNNMDEESARGVIRSLVYDGYINNNDQPKAYRFNSPILRLWWNKNVAN